MAIEPKKPALKKTDSKLNKKKPASTRDSLAKLRKDVNQIEDRLKRANSLTQSSVTALKNSFDTLSKRSGVDSAQIAQPIEELSNRLNSLIEQTRRDVAHDLQVVMEDPRIDTLGAALTKANKRLSAAEAQQAHVITQINEQIATLATAVDKRLRNETEARKAENAVLETRVNNIESGSAEAISQVGEKIVAFSEELTQRTETALSDIKRGANEHMLEKEQALEELKADLDRRVESVEDLQRNSLPSIERRLVTMTSRIEMLEDTAGSLENGPLQAPPAPVYAAQPTNNDSQAVAQLHPQRAENAEPVNAHRKDAFSADIPPASTNVSPPPSSSPSPISSADTNNAPIQSGSETLENAGEPVPFTPVEYVPQPPHAQGATALNTDNPYAAPNDLYAHNSQQTPPQYGLPPMPDAPPIMENPQASAAPIHNTGYDLPQIEHPRETMDNARPGVTEKSKKPRNKGGLARPVKMAALMAGVAVIGLMAGKTIMPKFMNNDGASQTTQLPPQQSTDTVPNSSANNQLASNTPTSAPPINTIEAVGDYSQTLKAPDLGANTRNGTPGDNRLTLQAAAEGGNPIAQFQLGLSNLEGGNSKEAVRLIRLAANQQQPAAQYRLAKLYEAGIGVKADPKTAINLLQRAADNGNRIAMHDLGHYYAQGSSDAPADINKAAALFTKAAERGVLDSQFNLGVLYQQGLGVPKSLVDSYAWFGIAGAQGDKVAAARAKVIEQEMSTQQLEQAKTRIKAFTPKRINEPANGIFRKLPWVLPTTPKVTSVKSAQTLLGKLGYDVGKPDGAMGPKTRNAVIQFERANGLPETGRVDSALMERLALAAGA